MRIIGWAPAAEAAPLAAAIAAAGHQWETVERVGPALLAAWQTAPPDVLVISQDADGWQAAVLAEVPATVRCVALVTPGPADDPVLAAFRNAHATLVTADAESRIPVSQILRACGAEAAPAVGWAEESEAPAAAPPSPLPPSPVPASPPPTARSLLGTRPILRTPARPTPPPEPEESDTPAAEPAWRRWRNWRPAGRAGTAPVPASPPPAPASDIPAPERRGWIRVAPRTEIVAVRQIVAVGGLGGGRHTSAVAVALAQTLATQHSVLLVDWDPRGGLVSWLGLPPADRCWEALDEKALDGGARVWDWTQRLWTPASPRWQVLMMAGRFPNRLLHPDGALLTEVLHQAPNRWDFVVVDCGSAWHDPRAQLVLQRAQAAIVCAGAAEFDRERGAQWLEWVVQQDWPVADRVAWVGTGPDRPWRAVFRTGWTATWDVTHPRLCGDACARWVATRAERPA